MLQKVEANGQAFLAAGTGYDIKIDMGLLNAVSCRKLRHQIIINYTNGRFHGDFFARGAFSCTAKLPSYAKSALQIRRYDQISR